MQPSLPSLQFLLLFSPPCFRKEGCSGLPRVATIARSTAPRRRPADTSPLPPRGWSAASWMVILFSAAQSWIWFPAKPHLKQ
jgi:hypothetical protein